MCTTPPRSPEAAPHPLQSLIPAGLGGSRRLRLWDLAAKLHCPVIGVCLEVAELRRLALRAGFDSSGSDFELHAGAVSHCAERNALSEALQRSLERRYVLAVRRFARAKSTEALRALWREALTEEEVAGPLWAAVTHPRCDAGLAHEIYADIHMLQHQVGTGRRVELAAFRRLREEQAVLLRSLAEVQKRASDCLLEKARELERCRKRLADAQAELVAKDAWGLSLLGELERLREAMPDLKDRAALARRAREAEDRAVALQGRLVELESRLAWREPPAPAAAPVAQQPAAAAATPGLEDRSVLCIGGRTGAVSVYRRLVERLGGRFLHHDGGQEDNLRRLEASLAAADLVICQTGCISHGAYWRVKDHCKRHGKRCLFLDNPSAASFSRGIALAAEAGAVPPDGTVWIGAAGAGEEA